MVKNYIVKDDKGNVGQMIPLTQGEVRQITVFFFNADGSPFVIPGTISEIVVKIFSAIGTASIQKKLSTTTAVAAVLSGITGGMIGVQFSLSAADTASMAPNNSGIPMTITVTDGAGIVTELDFIQVFAVSVPVVVT